MLPHHDQASLAPNSCSILFKLGLPVYFQCFGFPFSLSSPYSSIHLAFPTRTSATDYKLSVKRVLLNPKTFAPQSSSLSPEPSLFPSWKSQQAWTPFGRSSKLYKSHNLIWNTLQSNSFKQYETFLRPSSIQSLGITSPILTFLVVRIYKGSMFYFPLITTMVFQFKSMSIQ